MIASFAVTSLRAVEKEPDRERARERSEGSRQLATCCESQHDLLQHAKVESSQCEPHLSMLFACSMLPESARVCVCLRVFVCVCVCLFTHIPAVLGCLSIPEVPVPPRTRTTGVSSMLGRHPGVASSSGTLSMLSGY